MCKACYDTYGRDRSKWEPWLLFLLADDKRLQRSGQEIARHEVAFSDCSEAEALAYGEANTDPF